MALSTTPAFSQYDHKDHALTNLSEAANQMQAMLSPALDRCKRSMNMLSSAERELDEKVVQDLHTGAETSAAFVYKHFAVSQRHFSLWYNITDRDDLENVQHP